MSFADFVFYTRVLGDIAIGQMNILEPYLCILVHCPTHNVHHSCVTQGSATLHLQLKLATMVCLMASLTQSDEVIWSVASYLSTFQVVYVQNLVTTLAFAMLTLVVIPCKYVFTHIPKSHLLALLILHTLNGIVLDFLSIELCYLNNSPTDWQ